MIGYMPVVHTHKIEAGMLYRISIRKLLTSHGIKYSEAWGVFDSEFIVKCPDATWNKLVKVCEYLDGV
jgi:hypothetical protein